MKNRKIIFVICLIPLLVFSSMLSVFAAADSALVESELGVYDYRLIDETGEIPEDIRADIEAVLEEITNLGVDAVVLYTDVDDGVSIEDRLREIYNTSCDASSFLYGINVTQREFYFLTYDTGHDLLYQDLDYVRTYTGAIEMLKNNDFLGGMQIHLEVALEKMSAMKADIDEAGGLENYLEENNIEYNPQEYPEFSEQKTVGDYIFIFILIAVVVGLIGMLIMIAMNNSKKTTVGADSYLVDGKLDVDVMRNDYVTTTVTKTRIRDDSSSSGGSSSAGGGSRSSGGGGSF